MPDAVARHGRQVRPGARLLVKAATDKKGAPVGARAVSPSTARPSASSSRLHPSAGQCGGLLSRPTASRPAGAGDGGADGGGVWIGAHPSLGERVARRCSSAAASRTRCERASAFYALRSEVRETARARHAGRLRAHAARRRGRRRGADGADTAGEGAMTLVEVKHVIDTDYDPEGERAKAAAAAAAASPTKGKAKGGRAPPLFLGPAGARRHARAASSRGAARRRRARTTSPSCPRARSSTSTAHGRRAERRRARRRALRRAARRRRALPPERRRVPVVRAPPARGARRGRARDRAARALDGGRPRVLRGRVGRVFAGGRGGLPLRILASPDT